LDGFSTSLAKIELHEAEIEFLQIVSDTFGFNELTFEAMRKRHSLDWDESPYTILGIDDTASPEAVKQAWKDLARRYHPDRLRARGVPDEAARLAERRMSDINAAYDSLRKNTALRVTAS